MEPGAPSGRHIRPPLPSVRRRWRQPSWAGPKRPGERRKAGSGGVVGGPNLACLLPRLVFPFFCFSFLFFFVKERRERNRIWRSFLAQKNLKQIFYGFRIEKAHLHKLLFFENCKLLVGV